MFRELPWQIHDHYSERSPSPISRIEVVKIKEVRTMPGDVDLSDDEVRDTDHHIHYEYEDHACEWERRRRGRPSRSCSCRSHGHQGSPAISQYQYHNITRVALRIIIGEFDRNVMEGLSLSNVMEGLPLVVSLVIPLVVPLLKLSKSWHYQYWFSQFCHSGGFDNKGA